LLIGPIFTGAGFKDNAQAADGVQASPVFAKIQNAEVVSRLSSTIEEPEAIVAVAFSPNGRQLVGVPKGRKVVDLWDWHAPVRHIRSFLASDPAPLEDQESSVAFSPDSRLVAYVHGVAIHDVGNPYHVWASAVHVWKVDSNEVVHVIDESEEGSVVAGMIFASNGGWLVRINLGGPAASSHQLVAYDVSTWEVKWGLTTYPFKPSAIALSPNGREVALGGQVNAPGIPKSSEIWIVDLRSRAILRRIMAFPEGSYVGDLSWNAAGDRIATSASVDNVNEIQHTLKIFDASTGAEVAGAHAPDQTVTTFKYVGSRDYLLECGASDVKGVATIWDASLRHAVWTHTGSTGHCAVSPNRLTVAIAEGSALTVWDVK